MKKIWKKSIHRVFAFVLMMVMVVGLMPTTALALCSELGCLGGDTNLAEHDITVTFLVQEDLGYMPTSVNSSRKVLGTTTMHIHGAADVDVRGADSVLTSYFDTTWGDSYERGKYEYVARSNETYDYKNFVNLDGNAQELYVVYGATEKDSGEVGPGVTPTPDSVTFTFKLYDGNRDLNESTTITTEYSNDFSSDDMRYVKKGILREGANKLDLPSGYSLTDKYAYSYYGDQYDLPEYTFDKDKFYYISPYGDYRTTIYIFASKEEPVEYTLAYDEKGGNPVTDFTAPEGSACTLPTTERTDFEFQGWLYKFNENGKDYEVIYQAGYTFYMPGNDVTMEAQWKEVSKPIKYTVTYTDGVEDQTIFPNESYIVSEGDETPRFNNGINPTRAGHVFKGWSPEVTATVTDHTTYTAQWEAVTEYKIAYNGNSQAVVSNIPSGVVEVLTEASNVFTVSKDEPSTEGYDFAGWNTKADGTGESYKAGDSVDVTQDEPTVTLYAQWKKVYTYTWNFDYQKSDILNSWFKHTTSDLSVAFNQGLGFGAEALDVEPEDASFLGWATSPDGEVEFKCFSEYVDSFSGGPVDGTTLTAPDHLSMTYYAVWAEDPNAGEDSGAEVDPEMQVDPEADTEANADDADGTPETGDATDVNGTLVVMLFAVLGMVAVVYTRRKTVR